MIGRSLPDRGRTSMTTRSLAKLPAYVLLALSPSLAPAQDVNSASKDHEAFRSLFAPACEKVRFVTLRVRRDGVARAYATLVDVRGYAITKASEFEGAQRIECDVDGKRLEAKRGPVDAACDLLLLDLSEALRARGKPVAALSFASVDPAVGCFVACVGTEEVPSAIGVVSLPTYERSVRGLARARLDLPFKDDASEACLGPIREGPLAKSGLREGDVVESVDGRAVSSPRSFQRAIRRKRPGQRVRLELRRGDERVAIEVEVEASVDRYGPRDPQEALWGRLSRVRYGFPRVLQHDAVIDPFECGGPLVDARGRVLGVNIARVGRVETHALPADLVAKSVKKLMDLHLTGRSSKAAEARRGHAAEVDAEGKNGR